VVVVALEDAEVVVVAAVGPLLQVVRVATAVTES
jgi:hypothetical protein